jgi:hypothetical protein
MSHLQSNKSFVHNIKYNEKKIFSQYGQDGVIDSIFKNLEFANNPPYFVDCGGGEEKDNTRLLWEKMNWNGLIINKKPFKSVQDNVAVCNRYITSENIIPTFVEFNVPNEPDLISIDIDSIDLWIFKKIIQEYNPQCVCVEYNCNYPIGRAITLPNMQSEIVRDRAQGASLKALHLVGLKYGYALIHTVDPCDCFFLRKDLIDSTDIPDLSKFNNSCNKPSQTPPASKNRLSLLMDYEVYLQNYDIKCAKEAALDIHKYIGTKKEYKFIFRKLNKLLLIKYARGYLNIDWTTKYY